MKIRGHCLYVCFLPLAIIAVVFLNSSGKFKFRWNVSKNVFANSSIQQHDKTAKIVLIYKNSKWLFEENICQLCKGFRKGDLKTPLGRIPIYTHKPEADLISNLILHTKQWDVKKVKYIMERLESNRSLTFIDIGANIGTISLSIAKLGRKVLAIEALRSNVERLCCSVIANGLKNNLTIIHNAIASHSGVEVKLDAVSGNLGATSVDLDAEHILRLRIKNKVKRITGYDIALTVRLDDVLNLDAIKSHSNVIMKMDIEGFEHKVLLGADKFFGIVNVQAIFMEWVFHKNSNTAKIIIQNLSKRKFNPFTENGVRALNVAEYGKWPDDILWLPVLKTNQTIN